MTNLSAHSYKVFEWPSKTVALELQNEIEQFYYREAQLLDHRAYEAWFALLDKDIRYFMPLRTNRMIREGELEYSGDQDFAHFDETYETMYGRIRKVTSDLGWAENPPSRTRHLISNVIVKETATPDTFEVNSAFILPGRHLRRRTPGRAAPRRQQPWLQHRQAHHPARRQHLAVEQPEHVLLASSSSEKPHLSRNGGRCHEKSKAVFDRHRCVLHHQPHWHASLQHPGLVRHHVSRR
ncbi:aromatic-ring-hydroxylating dioxygenase subunit beta [Pseudoxanthomonas spadix]|uniref:aromatic-ring-hydroxylating dioxygenase subunit beta n=1 Tax=Pseudoxanthomonas spadix TaxID=415229 RepID=UPI0002F356D4